MSIAHNLQQIKKNLPPQVKLIAVSKTYPVEAILEAYNAGHRVFGENKVQELVEKQPFLPDDIEWHLIGHLQTNKIKYIAPFIHLIHAVDSLKLLQEINKQALKNNRVIDCLLQIHIAKEETKFGLSFDEVEQLINSKEFTDLKNIRIKGLMGMATNTDNEAIVRKEFRTLKEFYDKIVFGFEVSDFEFLSIGMSSDYQIAIEEGSNMIRIGTAIFGSRTN